MSDDKSNKGNLYWQILDELDRVHPEGLTAKKIQKNLKENFQRRASSGSIIISLRRLTDDFQMVRHEESAVFSGGIPLNKYFITPKGMNMKKEGDHCLILEHLTST